MTNDVSAEVEGYLDALARVRAIVGEGGPDQGSALALVIKRVRAREMGRSGSLHGGITYSVHGNGCLFTEANGCEVDVDFLTDGTEVFDSWRIRRFSLSRGGEPLGTYEELTHKCRQMVAEGALGEPLAGWFSLRYTE
ncbi:DUF6896 domain-containing protein [Kitasatospora sp. NPDC017646]|uniref:DUF6896 domain-containing protein n=1 Tax=Kitasatospora sp. NPDC017646 TaxID=3364024 RepID=UPI0037898500